MDTILAAVISTGATAGWAVAAYYYRRFKSACWLLRRSFEREDQYAEILQSIQAPLLVERELTTLSSIRKIDKEVLPN